MVKADQMDLFITPPSTPIRPEKPRKPAVMKTEKKEQAPEQKELNEKERAYVRFFRAGIFFNLPAEANLITISNVFPDAEPSVQAHLERQAQRQINELEKQRKKQMQYKGQMRFGANDILGGVELAQVKDFPINKGYKSSREQIEAVPENAKLYLIKDKSSQGDLEWFYGEEKSQGITELRKLNVSGIQFFAPFRPPVKNQNNRIVKPAGDLYHLIEELEHKREQAEKMLRYRPEQKKKKKKPGKK